MKSILRWVALLPACVLAMLAVNTINYLTVGDWLPELFSDISKSWFGSMAFVLAAYYVAPSYKSMTAVIVATLYCGFGIFGIVMVLARHENDHPAWNLITMAAISIVASALAALISREIEESKMKTDLEMAQKN